MERDIFGKLEEWKDSEDRKPLLLSGVRGCGKTYILREFGKRCFPDTAYFTFEKNPKLAEVFERDLDPKRILKLLSALRDKPIHEDTLIVLDEIQFCERAVTSLKYFCEDASEYHIIGAGSLLHVPLSTDAKADRTGYPVGKVDLLTLHPMSFREFLVASGRELLAEYAEENHGSELNGAILSMLDDLYREYLCVGGMPEAVGAWVERGDMDEVERLQDVILASYASDFARYAPRRWVPRIVSVWDSIPEQLSDGKGRFMFSRASPGARAADLESAVYWLVTTGLVRKVEAISEPMLPLKANADPSDFRLYWCDVGLLRRAMGMESRDILLKNDGKDGPLEGLTENYVLNELICDGFGNVFSWSSGRKAKVDFIVQIELDIVPMEVKAGERIRAAGLKEYIDRYAPRKAFLISGKNLKNGRETHLPLPLMWLFRTVCGSDRCHRSDNMLRPRCRGSAKSGRNN